MVLFSIVPGKPYYAIRFEDVPGQFILGGLCFVCSRTGPVDRRRLERRYGPTEQLRHLDRHLRCLGCGNRIANSFTVVGRLLEEPPAAEPPQRKGTG